MAVEESIIYLKDEDSLEEGKDNYVSYILVPGYEKTVITEYKIEMKKTINYEKQISFKTHQIPFEKLKENQSYLGLSGEIRIPSKILSEIKWKPNTKIWFEIDDEEQGTIIMGNVPTTKEEFLKSAIALGKE